MKEMNVLDQAINKAWALQEKQIKDVVAQVEFDCQWMLDALATARESVDSNATFLLPKTPSVKRRKLDIEECSDEEKEELEEAKKPRKLKRNAKDENRKTSKSTRSSRASNQSKKAAPRVTRLVKKANVDVSVLGQEREASILEVKESERIRSSDHVSNTTQSFCEHEADIDVVEEKTSAGSNNDTFVIEETKRSTPIRINEVSVVVEKLDNSRLTKSPEEVKINNAEPVHSTIREQETIEECIKLTDVTDFDKPQEKNEVPEICPVTSQVALGETIPKCDFSEKSTKDAAEVVKAHVSDKILTPDVIIKTVICPESAGISSPANKKLPEEQKAADSPKPTIPQIHISKIKERLFEKINSPAKRNVRQSLRLATKCKSPMRVMNTPEKLNSLSSKRKIACQIYDDEEADVNNMGINTPVSCSTKESEPNDAVNFTNDEFYDSPTTKGPKIFKPIKAKHIVNGVHSMIQSANTQKCDILEGPVTKQNNIVTGLFSFVKANPAAKAETVEERKQRMEEDVKKRDDARKKLVEQAEYRRQKEIDERKKRRQEREQRVADAQAKRAQAEEERIKMAHERFALLKKNEERSKKQREKEEDMKRKIREKKMTEAEAKRKNEDLERQAKIAEKEEEEKRKADYLQRKHEYEEQERKKKIEEQKKFEEQRFEQCARERLLQEDRIRREIEEREMLVKKRLDEKLQREKEEREAQDRKRIEKEKHEREVQEKVHRDKERKEEEAWQKEKEREAREKEAKDREAREAYYKRKLEQKQLAEAKKALDRTEYEAKHAVPMHPPQLPAKVQCTSYKTPTLSKVKSKVDKTKPPSISTYDIDNLSEDDSTDDDEDPDQEIPSWAKGDNLKGAIIRQIKTGMDPYDVFVNMLAPPKLEKMFPKLRARFFKRTSSACWDHPPRPFKTML